MGTTCNQIKIKECKRVRMKEEYVGGEKKKGDKMGEKKSNGREEERKEGSRRSEERENWSRRKLKQNKRELGEMRLMRETMEVIGRRDEGRRTKNVIYI